VKASGAPSKGDLVTVKLRIGRPRLAIMGLVVGETGTRVYIKVLKHSFNPAHTRHQVAALEHLMEHQNIVQVERADCKIVNSTSSA
jgi:hypothetical protein